MAFLSLLDDRAKPKGSRDPLGFELVWSHFGRKVIGNLTTITSSIDNFAVALLGFYWVNQLVPMDEQEDFTLYWERIHDHGGHVSGKTVICGHTAQDSGVPLNLGHTICIDTWVYGDGWLTCLDVDSGDFWQAQQHSDQTRRGNLAELDS